MSGAGGVAVSWREPRMGPSIRDHTMTENRTNRRTFGRATAGFATFSVVPRCVLGGPGYLAPSEKLNIAGIGVGGRGAGDIEELESQNIVALCDVDARSAAGTFTRHPKARKYEDFRVMLDKEDRNIDAVVVATPDHCHAPASLAAIRRGKHVYCEKPLSHTVYEARLMARAAREHNVATQMGNQGQAGEEVRVLCETIWAGAIGQVREVHVWTDRPLNGVNSVFWPQGIGRPTGTPPVPHGLNWNLWLGPAADRPYNPAYLPFTWRGWWDFGTGALGDIGCHALDPVCRALKLGHPVAIEACCTLVNDQTYPVASRVTYDFPARGDLVPVRVHWYDGGMKPPRPAELAPDQRWDTNGHLYVGDKGKILGSRIIPEARRREFGRPPRILERSPGHHQEWINACKGGKPAGSNFPDRAGLLAEIVLLGNVALRASIKEKLIGARLLWDGAAFRFTNLPEANAYLTKEYRAGWSL